MGFEGSLSPRFESLPTLAVCETACILSLRSRSPRWDAGRKNPADSHSVTPVYRSIKFVHDTVRFFTFRPFPFSYDQYMRTKGWTIFEAAFRLLSLPCPWPACCGLTVSLSETHPVSHQPQYPVPILLKGVY